MWDSHGRAYRARNTLSGENSGPKKGAGTKENMREPGFTNLVPEGRLNLAQDASPGGICKHDSSAGTAENRPGWRRGQPSAVPAGLNRRFKSNQGLSSWASSARLQIAEQGLTYGAGERGRANRAGRHATPTRRRRGEEETATPRPGRKVAADSGHEGAHAPGARRNRDAKTKRRGRGGRTGQARPGPRPRARGRAPRPPSERRRETRGGAEEGGGR